MSRWTLTEEATLDTWTMPISPNKVDPLPRTKRLSFALPSRNTQDRWRTFASPAEPRTLTWSGVIRTQAHFDDYVEWAKKPGVIVVNDHLGRTWRVLIASFKPTPRAGRRTSDYRMPYTVTVQWLGRTSG